MREAAADRGPIEMPRGSRALIAPSLLSCDFNRMGEEVAALEAAGADWLHVDVMDGRFVPNISIGLPIVEALRRVASRPLDVHLMIEEPERYVEAFARAGADIITVHAEATRHLHRCVQMVRGCGKRVGVSLNPHTPLGVLDYVGEALDLVLIMTVNPGFGGQRYIEACTRKVSSLRARCEERGWPLDVSVDGGVKVENIAQVARAGANVFVSGSGILGTSDYGATIAAMRAQL